jgi:hypothetical protein
MCIRISAIRIVQSAAPCCPRPMIATVIILTVKMLADCRSFDDVTAMRAIRYGIWLASIMLSVIASLVDAPLRAHGTARAPETAIGRTPSLADIHHHYSVAQAQVEMPSLGEDRAIPREVLIEIASGVSPRMVRAIARRHRLIRIDSNHFRLTGKAVHRWRIDDGRPMDTVVRELANDRRIGSVQPNSTYRMH